MAVGAPRAACSCTMGIRMEVVTGIGTGSWSRTGTQTGGTGTQTGGTGSSTITRIGSWTRGRRRAVPAARSTARCPHLTRSPRREASGSSDRCGMDLDLYKILDIWLLILGWCTRQFYSWHETLPLFCIPVCCPQTISRNVWSRPGPPLVCQAPNNIHKCNIV